MCVVSPLISSNGRVSKCCFPSSRSDFFPFFWIPCNSGTKIKLSSNVEDCSFYLAETQLDRLEGEGPVQTVLGNLVLLYCLDLEWKLSESGAIKTDLEENPKKPVEDALLSSVRCSAPMRRGSDSEEGD